MDLPLQGTKVVDISEQMASPYCKMLLGDAGAEVVKVEPPEGDWSRHVGLFIQGESALFLAPNRNKKSIVIDFRKARGRQLLLELIKGADVFVTSAVPNELEQLELAYEYVEQVNPRIIYAYLPPLGERGPYREMPALELEAQAIASVWYRLGERWKPPIRVGADIASITGGMSAYLGILAALFYRRKHGVGQKVVASPLSALLAFAWYLPGHSEPDEFLGWLLTCPFDQREIGYQTRDQRIIWGLSLKSNPKQSEKAWRDFAPKVGLGELLNDPRWLEYGPRSPGIGRDAQEMKPVFESVFAEKSADELESIIAEVGGAGARFNDYEAVYNHPQIKALDMVCEMKHPIGSVKVLGMPWKLSETLATIRMLPPMLGQHTDEILSSLGYADAEVTRLKESGVVA